MATAEEIRGAAYRASLIAREAARKAREVALKGNPVTRRALALKTAPLLSDDPDGRP